MKSSLTKSPDNDKPKPATRRTLAISLATLSVLLLFRPPFDKKFEREVMKAVATILRKKGCHSEQIADALYLFPRQRLFSADGQPTVKELDRHELYQALSAAQRKVIAEVVGVERVDEFMKSLEWLTASPTSPEKGEGKGEGEPSC